MRRESPRITLTRRVIFQCANWESFVEVDTVNISRDAFLVRLDKVPPAAGEQVKVWLSLAEGEGRRWTAGEIVRLHPEPDRTGDPGVVIQLIEPGVEAMDCLILKGMTACPRPDDLGPEDEFACYDDPASASVPMPESVEIDLDAPLEEEGDGDWVEPLAPAVGPPPTDAAPDQGPLAPMEAEVGGGPIPDGKAKVPVYLPPPPAAIGMGRHDQEAGAGARTPTSGADSTNKAWQRGTDPEAGESDERPSARTDGTRARPRSKKMAGVYIMRPEETVDDVGAAIGFASGLAQADTVVSLAVPEPSPSPSPVPPGLSASDTLVSALPEDLLDDEGYPGGLDAGDTVVGPVPDEDSPAHEVEPLVAEIDDSDAALDGAVTLDTVQQTIAPSVVEVAARIATPIEVSRQDAVIELTSDDEVIEPTDDDGVYAELEEESALDTDIGTGPVAPSADSSGVRQISARSGWASERAPAIKGRAEAPVVGIDFGTTYSKVAVCAGEEVILIEDTSSTSASRASVPSIVAWTGRGKYVVGEQAKEILATDPVSVIYSVKRVMGLKRSDPLANGLLGSLACPSRSGPNDSILFDVHGHQFTVPEVASLLLGHLRQMASRYVEADVRKAVFTYPVDFDQRAKRELELAARMAGLEVVGMVAEPVAAAMGCGYDGGGQSLLVVYDFGGGTFDVSVVEVGHDRFSVRGAAGDRWLGGDDFDEIMARHVADEFQNTRDIALHNRAEEWQRLLFACEEAKRWLTSLDTVDVVLPNAALTKTGPETLLVPMTRATFNDLASDIITSSLEVCLQASGEAGLGPKEMDALLVTGGTTRIPAVRQAAEHFFGKTAVEGIHPQHAVVIGAAVRAAVLSGTQVPEDFVDRLKGHGASGRNIGLALAGGATEHIIRGTERLPTVAHRLYSTHRDGQTTIRIELVEGTSEGTAENRRIGGFVVENLPARNAGAITLDVYFELSSTGTLFVTAQERSTGLRAQGTFELNDSAP